MHVASLFEAVSTASADRTSRTLGGFAAGMSEPLRARPAAPFASDLLTNFIVFDASDSSLGAVITVEDVFDKDPVVNAYTAAFGKDNTGRRSIFC